MLFLSASRHANLRQRRLRGNNTPAIMTVMTRFAGLVAPIVILCLNKVSAVILIIIGSGKSSKNGSFERSFEEYA